MEFYNSCICPKTQTRIQPFRPAVTLATPTQTSAVTMLALKVVSVSSHLPEMEEHGLLEPHLTSRV